MEHKVQSQKSWLLIDYMGKRIVWIDYAKTFCIFLVVLGHTQLPPSIKSIIYVFHIPLFFFISGVLFSFEKYTNYNVFLKKRLIQLVIPYFFFNFVTYFIWLIIGRKVGNDVSLGLNPLKQFLGIFLGNDANHHLEHCASLWFLACLFVVENMYYLIFRHLKTSHKVIGLGVFALIGYLDYHFNPYRFPWGLNVAFVTILFYGLGSLLRSRILDPKRQSVFKWTLLSVFSFLIVILIARLNGKVEVSIGDYRNYGYFLIGALLGITFVVSISKAIAQYLGKIQLFQYIGRNTLIILGFHLLAGSFIKAITFSLLKLPLSIYDYPNLSLPYSIVSILLLIPVMLFMNKYLPFAIGKAKL